MKQLWIGLAAALCLAPPAWADNVAHCEALIMQILPSDDGQGEAQIASYRPAVNFLASLYDQEDGHLTEIDGFPIRAIMCRRNDVIPAITDYPILATGLPFVLSQDFDSTDTDSLTMYWKDGKIEQVYKGYPLSEDALAELENRLIEFSKRGLNESARTASQDAAKASDQDELEEDKQDQDTLPEKVDTLSPEPNTDTDPTETDMQTEIEIKE